MRNILLAIDAVSPDNAAIAYACSMARKKNTFLVMGAYGRSGFSMLLRQSHADSLIHLLKSPIFIAHKL
jgi:regulator of extracellular matrix RemA (YlzA/DUF370 family)